MREKRGGLSRVQRLKKRLSHSFGRLGKCLIIIVGFGSPGFEYFQKTF